jgi:hypothetical protein
VLDEIADLLQREPSALGHVDDRQATQHALVVAALPARVGQQPELLVVTDQRDADPGSPGRFADAHLCVVHVPLDLKLA